MIDISYHQCLVKGSWLFCHLLLFSNFFVFNSLATKTAVGEKHSGDQQQPDSSGLSAFAPPFNPNANNRGWLLWHFDCPDFTSLFSKSSSQWVNSLRRTKEFFRDVHFTGVSDILLPVKLPSTMVKEISGKRMVGIALFRNGIEPYGYHSTCQGGGFFTMSVLTTTANPVQLTKINAIYRAFLAFALHGLSAPLQSEVSGIFVRANLRPLRGKSAAQHNDNNHQHQKGNLPCFTFELWIRDEKQADEFLPLLEEWTAKQQRENKEMTIEAYGFQKH